MPNKQAAHRKRYALWVDRDLHRRWMDATRRTATTANKRMEAFMARETERLERGQDEEDDP